MIVKTISIMKKIFILALAATALFAFASCQKTDVTDGTANVTINVGHFATKAIADGKTATKLIYEVYHVGDNAGTPQYTLVTEGTTDLVELQTKLDFTLMRDNKYVALFWAQSPTAPYNTDDLRTVKMNYAGDPTIPNGNNESRDAFYGMVEFTVSNDDTANEGLTCELVRPFAQINIVATDYEERENANITELKLTSSTVTLSKLSTTFNVLTGKADPAGTDPGNYKFDFEAADVIAEEFDSIDPKKTWISMNYILLPDGATSVNVEATFNVTAKYAAGTELNHVIEFPATAVDAATNYRTNIVGEIFTEGGNVAITVNPDFLNPDKGTLID